MKKKINSYFAVLIVVVAGASATLLILHIIDLNSFNAPTVMGSEVSHSQLQKSIGLQ